MEFYAAKNVCGFYCIPGGYCSFHLVDPRKLRVTIAPRILQPATKREAHAQRCMLQQASGKGSRTINFFHTSRVKSFPGSSFLRIAEKHKKPLKKAPARLFEEQCSTAFLSLFLWYRIFLSCALLGRDVE